MAFYEMLPGAGMPAGLQAGMDSVLNKKFGTSTTYPAEDWPDTVNLMGPLPEKTVSGAIATFADGADAVPLKKCEITLPASLDGYTEVDVKHTGKNLLNDSIKTKFGGSILFAGASSSSDVNIILPAGTYTMTLKLNVNINVNLYLKDIDTNTNITGFPYYNTASTEPKSRTFTLDHTTRLCAWTYNGDFTSTSEVDYCMIEAGSSATTYEPYTAPDTHTASLGRTIYGGTADVVNGTGTDENGNDFTFDPVPIDSKLGNNTLWSEQGSDTEVTYRADINLALGGN